MNRKHTSMLLIVVLLLGALVVATAAAEEQTPTAPIVPNSPETEPNDDFDTATYIDWDTLQHGKINPAGDVDTYRFYAGDNDLLAVNFYQPATSPLKAILRLYDQDGNLLASNACASNGTCLEYVFTGGSDRYLQVTNAEPAGGAAYDYRIALKRGIEIEPNDFPSEATPITYDQWIYASLMPCGDVDYYTFEGQAGDLIRIEKEWWQLIQILDADLNVVAESGYDDYGLELTLPVSGTYYVYLDSAPDSRYCGSYSFRVFFVDQPLYISLNKAGTIQGVTFTAGDVLRYWTQSHRWEMFLDLSDVGLTGNLTALDYNYDSLYEDNVYFLGFLAKYTNDAVGTVMPQDLVGFYPASTGTTTAGELYIAFDGSDVGLTTSDERIDAVATDGYYSRLLLSTVGRARVPFGLTQLTLQDEDLARFDLNWRELGDESDGAWRPSFDGSIYGLASADIISVDQGNSYYDEATDRYIRPYWFSLDQGVKFGGVYFSAGDIAECLDYDAWDDIVRCDLVGKLFDASDAGLTGFKIDALEVGYKD